jgi:hypothetical protein
MLQNHGGTMNDEDAEKFLSAIGVSAAKEVLSLLKKTNCLVLGIGGGLVIAAGPMQAGQGFLRQSASISSLISENVSPVPSRSGTIANILITLGLATAVVGGTCKIIKVQLKNYIDDHDTYASAMKDLTPELKISLKSAADKIMNLSNRIEDALKEQQGNLPYNPDLIA